MDGTRGPAQRRRRPEARRNNECTPEFARLADRRLGSFANEVLSSPVIGFAQVRLWRSALRGANRGQAADKAAVRINAAPPNSPSNCRGYKSKRPELLAPAFAFPQRQILLCSIRDRLNSWLLEDRLVCRTAGRPGASNVHRHVHRNFHRRQARGVIARLIAQHHRNGRAADFGARLGHHL
jgi:hypothetical protein